MPRPHGKNALFSRTLLENKGATSLLSRDPEGKEGKNNDIVNINELMDKEERE